MDCMEAKSYVEAYIDHNLPERKQAEFIKHVQSCPECFQELETYFIVDVALKYFDNNKGDTYDIRGLLQQDLDKRLKKYQNKRIMIVSLIVLSVLFLVLILGLLLRWFI